MAPMSEPLPAEAIRTALTSLPGWSGGPTGLTRSYKFADFTTAMAFMQAVAPAIDAGNHHPEWANVYNRISVTLRTHDAGDRVTELDVTLARLLDTFAAKYTTR
jgi:4a-hydroxytetrahydrobiopterin dehydratase